MNKWNVRAKALRYTCTCSAVNTFGFYHRMLYLLPLWCIVSKYNSYYYFLKITHELCVGFDEYFNPGDVTVIKLKYEMLLSWNVTLGFVLAIARLYKITNLIIPLPCYQDYSFCHARTSIKRGYSVKITFLEHANFIFSMLDRSAHVRTHNMICLLSIF
jgi:hypothetical protein